MDAFDLAHGTDTSRSSRLWWTRIFHGLKSKTCHYQAVDPQWFADAMKDIPKHLPFIDMGCGRGRALILAHEMGFHYLTGVEFSPALCRSARRNLSKLGIEAAIICKDAREFHFTGPCIVFLYNPFYGDILKEVLAHIPSHSYIVYINPKQPELFQQFQMLTDLGHSHVYLKANVPPIVVIDEVPLIAGV